MSDSASVYRELTAPERLALIATRTNAVTPAQLLVPFQMQAAGEFMDALVAAKFFPEIPANKTSTAVPIYISNLSPDYPPVACVKLDLAMMMRYAVPMTTAERATQIRFVNANVQICGGKGCHHIDICKFYAGYPKGVGSAQECQHGCR